MIGSDTPKELSQMRYNRYVWIERVLVGFLAFTIPIIWCLAYALKHSGG